jgi:hypothetical protein
MTRVIWQKLVFKASNFYLKPLSGILLEKSVIFVWKNPRYLVWKSVIFGLENAHTARMATSWILLN